MGKQYVGLFYPYPNLNSQSYKHDKREKNKRRGDNPIKDIGHQDIQS